MKVTNGDVWLAATAINDLLKPEWPVKTAYGLARLSRKIGTARRDIDAVRTDLIKRHGEETEPGRLEVKPEMAGFADFAAAFNELMAEEVEIDWGPVVLPEPKSGGVTGATLAAMGPFVNVDETDAAAGDQFEKDLRR